MRMLPIAVLAMICAFSQLATAAGTDRTKYERSGIKPIAGTWLNLFHQDARNEYTNPADVDMTSPALWRRKISEMSEMGIRYLVLLAVAHEGKAMYESDFLPAAYPVGRESPVEAIMEAADAGGMRVFMSSGWARNEDDDMSDPDTRGTQLRIMRECAERFRHHPSFFGWYFPCEFRAAPWVADRDVEGVNALAAAARALTPGAKLMISPHVNAKLIAKGYFDLQAESTYVDQLAALDVDILAYQDGVGCAFVTQPQAKKVFGELREVHGLVPHLAIWGNVETFTWAGKSNDRSSPLVPAAFPRVLSQMAAVSPSVDETISFIVQGILDEPGSPMPLGEAVYSQKLAGAYEEFLAGRGRWPLLAASFTGNLLHEAVGKAVSIATRPAANLDGGDLTDGLLGAEDLACAEWLGFEKTDMEATIDLGGSTRIRTLAARFLQYAAAGILLPSRVDFAISRNGRDFEPVASITPERWPHDRYDTWIDMAVARGLDVRGRYVRVQAVNAGQFLFVDELLVNPRIRRMGPEPAPAPRAR